MNRILTYSHLNPLKGSIRISGSKSLSNRLLILQQLFSGIQVHNLSDSDDTRVLQKALHHPSPHIDVGHAGTAMRFLTAYFAVQEGKTTRLSGSKRMHQRPIKALVDALNSLGADIQYVEKEGFPPLLIHGKKISEYEVRLPARNSSQYVSALILIAPSLPNGLVIHLEGAITSKPYIDMSLSLLDEMGVESVFKKDIISIFPVKKIQPKTFQVEPDWSSASYFYSLAALIPGTEITLPGFRKQSLQGDKKLADYYVNFGVSTEFTPTGIRIKSQRKSLPKHIAFDLQDTPDLAQTLAVTCLGLQINVSLTGLHTLKIKETDRLQALKNELEKWGAEVIINEDSLQIFTEKISFDKFSHPITVNTYDDHRMAMAFAPLACKSPLIIENSTVVSKSYKKFWEDFENILKTGTA